MKIRIVVLGLMALILSSIALISPLWAASKPAVVVLAVPSKGVNLRGPVKKHVSQKMAEAVNIIGLKPFSRAGAKLKVKKRALYFPKGARKVAQAVGASHVVFIQPIKKKRKWSVIVNLLNVESGKRLSLGKFSLVGKNLTKKTGTEIWAALKTYVLPPTVEKAPVEKVKQSEAPSDAAKESNSKESAEADDLDLALEAPVKVADVPVFSTVNGAEAAVGEDSLNGSSTDTMADTADSADAERTGGAAPRPEIGSVNQGPQASSDFGFRFESGAKREAKPVKHWLRMHLGGGIMQRLGVIPDSDNAASYISCYCNADGSGNPPFMAGIIQLEAYPLLLAEFDGALRGIGLHADMEMGLVTTVVGTTEHKSTVISGVAGLTYQLLLGDEITEGDLQFKAGYGTFRFPLADGAFPGTIYGGPYLGVALNYPLVDFASLQLGGHYSIPLSASGGTKRIGESFDRGSGFRVEGGFRFSVAKLVGGLFEVGVLGRFERFDTKYKGKSSLRGGLQTENATLQDQTISAMATAGLVF